MYTRRLKRSVLSIKEKQAIILRLEKEEKGTNLSAEYGVSKQQISVIRKSKENIMTWSLPTRVQVFTTDSEDVDHIVFLTIKCHFLNVISFCSLLIFIFSIIRTLDYPDYFV